MAGLWGPPQNVEYGSDLQGWQTAANGEDGITITTQEVTGEDYELVTAAIPRTLVPGGDFFARLKATRQ